MPSLEVAGSPTSLRIISLNCWGLKYLAKWRHERLSEIGDQIATADPAPDIVGLQECWTQQDYETIREKAQHILPYGKFYHSGIFGGGLVILSRWRIVESGMYRYPLNGRPQAFWRGDWFVGKGVAWAKIRMGESEEMVEVFCTHLHAPYETEPYDSYLCHRTAQAWEIAKLMRGAAERGNLVIGLGDFNMRPLSLAHRLIEAHSPVRDVWRLICPDSSIGAAKDVVEQKRGRPMPTAEYNISFNGTTCDSALNTWRWNKALQKRLFNGENVHIAPSVEDPRAKRLDYIFFSNGPRNPKPLSRPSSEHQQAKTQHHIAEAEKEHTSQDLDTRASTSDWILQEASVGMTSRHPTLRCSLSDHFSIEVTLVRPRQSPADHNNPFLSISSTSSAHQAQPPKALPLETYDEILEMISVYVARERQQRRLRLAHFGVEFCVAIGCLVAVWWSPWNSVSFILMLVSTLGLSAGLLDGLMGGLFVGSELRALKEFEWEIRNAREMAKSEHRATGSPPTIVS